MKLQIALPFFLVCFVLVSCSDDNNNPMTDNGNQEPFVITSEAEYAVYRAVIEDLYVIDTAKLILIKHTTVFDPRYRIGSFDFPDKLSVSPETFDSFQNRNQQSQAIDCTQLSLSVPCKVLDQKVLDEIFTKDDERPTALWDNWNRFYETYPESRGITEISRVGFNTKGNEALIYVGHRSYDLAGFGLHVLLVRKDDTWVIHSKEVTWQS